MLLVFDIGNSTVSAAIMQGHKFKFKSFLEFRVSQKQLISKLSDFIESIHRKKYAVEHIVICSVVPEVTVLVKDVCRKFWKTKIYVTGKDLIVPMKNNYLNPHQVGQDRLVGAYGARCLYGQPLIIIDFGTAITFDVVSKKGDYEGGIIVPGLRLSLESLFKKTALLPHIEEIKPPKNLIGRDTKTSMLSGIFNGYGAMCTGLIKTISQKIKGHPKVVMTGGHTDLVKRYIAVKINHIDADLVFKGSAFLVKNLPL